MKQFAILFLLVFTGIYSNSYAQLKIPTLELHLSGNRPLSTAPEEYTFFGGGLGANVVFWDARLLSFKTGVEINYFHTWNNLMSMNKENYKINANYNSWDLSIPLMFRLNMGQKVKFFVEAGGYVGIPLVGSVTYTDMTYSPPGIEGNFVSLKRREKDYDGYFSLSAAGSVGGIFPVSQRVDLIVKPEFVFRRALNIPAAYGSVFDDFNEQFFYARLCLGIRLDLNKKTE